MKDYNGHLRFIGKFIDIVNITAVLFLTPLFHSTKKRQFLQRSGVFTNLDTVPPFLRQAACLQNLKPSKSLDGDDVAFF